MTKEQAQAILKRKQEGEVISIDLLKQAMKVLSSNILNIG